MKDIGQQVDATDAKPCEYFDLIGGTSTEGMVAIMLGILGMEHLLDAIMDCVLIHKVTLRSLSLF